VCLLLFGLVDEAELIEWDIRVARLSTWRSKETWGRTVANKIEGEVVSVDADGCLITSVMADSISEAPRGDQTVVCCDEYETVGIFDSVEEQPESTLVAYVGEQGNLKLTIVGMNASELLGIKVGAPIAVSW